MAHRLRPLIRPQQPQTPPKIRIATYNTRGLSGKADLVMQLWSELKLDVLGLTETWLRPEDRFLLPLPYDAISIPLGGRRRGHGGIAIVHC